MRSKRTIHLLVMTSAIVLGAGCAIDAADEGASLLELEPLAATAAVEIETAHPYMNNTDQSWTITAPAWADTVTVHFDRFETEPYYDYLDVYDIDGDRVVRLTGDRTGESVTVEGHVVELRFHSDYSITRWGFSISRYEYSARRPEDHRPFCDAIGSRSEGWYWGDTGELIGFGPCAELEAPQCLAIGSRSEGWYSNGEPALITYDNCRATEGLAVVGESCGPSINVDCFGDAYCQGIPEDRRGATGTCREMGFCLEDADCDNEENNWIHPACVGFAFCNEETSTCAWECGSTPMGPLSWTTILLRDVQSAHPYDNDFSHTWEIVREGAEAMRVHFARIEIEEGYDRLILTGDREERALMIDGTHSDYWSREIGGDRVHLTLETDSSVTRWGFRADMISFLVRLPEGMCNRDEDCGEGAVCNVPRCFNPYETCFGRCQLLELGGEGDPCDDERRCGEGLTCKAIGDDGVGECHDELWCDAATVEADCAAVIHPAVPGLWACGEEQRCEWVPTMMAGSWFNDAVTAIPDNDPAGIVSEITPAGLASCAVDVSLDLTVRHTYIGDLVVGLTDPSGRRALIHDRDGGSADDLVIERLDVADLGDEGGAGVWRLDVSDRARLDVGALEGWSLHLRCR
jgi:hypothetical protein